MSEQSLPGTPGTGDVPEPEDPEFRQQVIEEAEEERKRKADELAERSEERKEFYAGGAAEDEEGDEPLPDPAPQQPTGDPGT